jgi:hypothetical protein
VGSCCRVPGKTELVVYSRELLKEMKRGKVGKGMVEGVEGERLWWVGV